MIHDLASDIIPPMTASHQSPDAAWREEMARDCYGYGRWDAPYWFIGPEQGQGHDDLSKRFEVWKVLDKDGLCDCRAFHRIIEPKWHCETDRKNQPPLQRTWDKLIILLKAFDDDPSVDPDARRRYQRDELGMLNGKTCIIELSGLAAHDLRVDRGTMRRDYLPQRIEAIRKKIAENTPKFVVMYRTKQKTDWQEIAGCELDPGKVVFRDGTAFVMAEHPVSKRGSSNEYWSQIGFDLRKAVTHIGHYPTH